MSINLHLPTRVSFGSGALKTLVPATGKILLITSPSLPPQVVNELASNWQAAGINTHQVIKPPGEPMSGDVDAFFASLPGNFTAVAGVGGGSVLDFAKAIALLAATGGSISDYEFGLRKAEAALPLYLAPTTCGSGSEVTPYCVINNSVTGRKFTITHPALQPVQAAIDPELLRTLAAPDLLATSLDAFIHCLEALLTRANNQLIAPFAEEGLRIGMKRLGGVTASEPSSELLEELALLSLFGGISIAHSRTGLIHTLSVAFAEFCPLPHGMLNARLLPFALGHNLSGFDGLLATVVKRCTGAAVNSDKDAFQRLTSWVAELTGPDPVAPGRVIRSREEKIVSRVLQDAGLPLISHGIINDRSIRKLVEEIADAAG